MIPVGGRVVNIRVDGQMTVRVSCTSQSCDLSCDCETFCNSMLIPSTYLALLPIMTVNIFLFLRCFPSIHVDSVSV